MAGQLTSQPAAPAAEAPKRTHVTSSKPEPPPRAKPPLPSSTSPRTSHEALLHFRAHWATRDYSAAAASAALAQTLAESTDRSLARKCAAAHDLALRYHALRLELRASGWPYAPEPVLQPDDPASSEARCNMLCTPDRPMCPIPGKAVVLGVVSSELSESGESEPSENANVDRLVQKATPEEDAEGLVCCLPYLSNRLWGR